MPKRRAIFIRSIPRVPSSGAPTSIQRICSWGTVMALLTCLLAGLPASTVAAAQGISMPFPGGQAVRIIQGYNGGTHRGRSQYGLDLVLANGETSGAEVLSPVDGTVTWAQAPGGGNGCLAIAFRDESYSVTVCHVILNRPYARGDSIARGDSLGTVGPAGAVGNNGAPHVHLELHRGAQARSPVPFSPPEGLPLDGVALAASGTYNEHGTRAAIASANRGGSVLVASAQPGRPPLPLAARSTPGQQIAPSAASQTIPARPPSTGEAARTPAPTRAAVIQGTGSCLKVREQPSAEAPIVKCLPDGANVTLLPLAAGAQSQWRQIDQAGWWVAAEYLRRTHAVVKGTDTCLNVRESPSAGAAILGCLPEGSAVAIAEGPTAADALTWYRIERAQPLQRGGWVVAKYLD
jgi:hypothetical protein